MCRVTEEVSKKSERVTVKKKNLSESLLVCELQIRVRMEENKVCAEEEGILGWSVSLLFIAAPAKPKEG